MRTIVVLISVDYTNARKICEFIENQTLTSMLDASIYILDMLNPDVGEDEDIEEPRFYSMTDFMDAVNNQEIDNLTNYFISYINLPN